MKFINSIDVRGGHQKRVELYQGDLTALAEGDELDLLVDSAFADNYVPIPNSLIGALYRKGLSAAMLAATKDVDLRKSFSCWLSQEFTNEDAGLRFRRILCFEPLIRRSPPELVGDIFRALTPMVADTPDIRSIAMPVVATGNQGHCVAEMLKPLMQAALQWLGTSLPLDCIKIVTRSEADAQEASRLFADEKAAYRRFAPASEPPKIDYDVFISYSRKNAKESEALEKVLRESRPGIRIFVDRNELDIGSAWQPEIFETLDKCWKVVTLLSSDYLGSKVCKEEFNIAWIKGRETNTDVISSVNICTTALPTYMKYWNYFDCREGDPYKISDAAKRLLAALGT